ncbi:hypothetical protein DPMN_098910 [Dreissena polymorpha]|uniref:Uncharacterized protein n=1 Tax=Dreissena polymorpha TaxID=45954 RepID=A0A9D4LEJ1_DREPO|nr:hypothetical protein DPMN_098910 [Dreissena polymorpha]
MKQKYVIEQLDDDSEEVFISGMIDRSEARPDSLVDLCLADFASWFVVDYRESDSNDPQSSVIAYGDNT